MSKWSVTTKLMQTLRKPIFILAMLLIIVSLNGNNNNLKVIRAFADISSYKTDSIIIPFSGSSEEKPIGINKKIVMHIHPSLNVTFDGKTFIVPTGVGINTTLWNDHSLDQYGMQEMAPLHTHDSSGIIHVESNEFRNYTLGQFLKIWGIDLSGKEVKLSVNGNSVKDYENHMLADKEQMVMDIEDQQNITSN